MRKPHCIGFLLLLLVATPLVAESPCSNREGTEQKVLYDYKAGIDLTVYNRVAGRHVGPLAADPASAEQRNDGQRRAWANAFDKIDHLGLSYRQARDAYWEGYELLRKENDSAILRQEIKIYQEKEIYDYDRCQYIYEVELVVPSVPSFGRFSDPLREIISSLRAEKQFDDGVEIEIDALIRRLIADPRFKELVRQMLADPGFREDLKYRDDDTQRLVHDLSGNKIEIVNYDRGQYRVSAFIGSLIHQAVVPRVKELLGKHGKVQVTCWGYTDPLPVRNIQYQGYAAFGRPYEEVTYRMPDTNQSSAERSVRTNDDLSIARGFEGVHALAIALGEQGRNPRLELRYAGGGEVPSAQADRPESRKIKYVIKFRDR